MIAKSSGKRLKSIVNTIIFRLGDEWMVAKIVSGFSPVLYIPWPMGATQFAHTPKGAPKSIPTREWMKRFLVLGLLGTF